MNLVAFLLAFASVIILGVEFVRTKSYVTLALAFAVAAAVAELVLTGGTLVHLG